MNSFSIDCLISLFYIKPQQDNQLGQNRNNCLISLFYIKPQPMEMSLSSTRIVLYLYSTSNHNVEQLLVAPDVIVLYLYSTSNHNRLCAPKFPSLLSYIFILHQTTTLSLAYTLIRHCLISLFYIKPQRKRQVRRL